MKSSLVLLAFTLLFAATAEAQWCAKCYSPPGGGLFCAQSTHDGAETCTGTDGYICTLRGSCAGMDGPECADNRPCVHEKWVDGSRLPERARWMVATVEVRHSSRERAKL